MNINSVEYNLYEMNCIIYNNVCLAEQYKEMSQINKVFINGAYFSLKWNSRRLAPMSPNKYIERCIYLLIGFSHLKH